MNPLFGYGIGDVLRLYKQVKQNPSMLGDLLVQNGRIDQSQLQAMQGMNPQQMGQYMTQNNIMGQNFLQKGNEYAAPIRNSVG